MRYVNPPGGLPWALIGLCGASVLLNVVLLMRGATSAEECEMVAAASEPIEASSAAISTDVFSDGPGGAPTIVIGGEDAQAAVITRPATEASAGAVAAARAPTAIPPGVHVVRANVSRNLAYTFQQAVTEGSSDVLSQVYARLFHWDLDLRSDLQPNDDVRVVYTWDGTLAHIEAASYVGSSLGAPLHAYRFQATGDAFPSYWNEGGREVARRLVNGPIEGYEQITALLKDRPSHKGMDFKAPVGTPVRSPKAGKVLRTDWNTRYNGNCIEIRYDDGVVAKFLHLSRTDVKPGQALSAGALIGLSGNTGRSTAPHLHYELARSERVLDPVDYHGVTQRSLPAADQSRFEVERDRLAALLHARD